MNLDHIRYFLMTAQEGHLGRAARRLNVTPSTVSHAIASLESELAVPLFERRGRAIVLSQHGRLVQERATLLMQQVLDFKKTAGTMSGELKGSYRLGAAHDLLASTFIPMCARLKKKNPEAVFELQSLRSADVLTSILSGSLDAGLCYSPMAHPDLEFKKLSEGMLLIAVRKKHPILQSRNHRQIETISEYNTILPKAAEGIEICERHPALIKHGIQTQIAFTYDSYNAAVELLTSTDCWSLLPADVIERSKGGIVAVAHPRTWAAPYQVALVWSRKNASRELIEALCSADSN